MRSLNFVVYPEAQAKLDKTGITKRIENARRSHNLSVGSYVSEREVVECINEMTKEKYFINIPKEIFPKVKERWTARDTDVFWTVERKNGTFKEKVDAIDFLHVFGWRAKEVLKKEELQNFQSFGFSTYFEFAGVVGAAIENMVRYEGRRAGYTWQSVRPDGSIFNNSITGDTHCDLRVFQNEVTPYKTTDFLDNIVSYRPQTDEDRNGIFAYHSNEPSMLVAVLKWVDQLKIETETLGKNTNKTIEWAKSLGQGGGTCAEHFFPNDGHHTLMSFIGWEFPLIRLDDKGKPQGRCIDHLVTQEKNYYGAFVGLNGELVFKRQWIEGRELKTSEDKSTVYHQSEADHLVRGLLHQCAHGLGRTSANELIDMLSFRYSDKFEPTLSAIGAKKGK